MKLETERLILRDFVKEDWRRAFEYESDPLYLRYYEWIERTPESVQEFIGWFLAHQQQDPRFKFQLAITLKSNNLLTRHRGFRIQPLWCASYLGALRCGQPRLSPCVGKTGHETRRSFTREGIL